MSFTSSVSNLLFNFAPEAKMFIVYCYSCIQCSWQVNAIICKRLVNCVLNEKLIFKFCDCFRHEHFNAIFCFYPFISFLLFIYLVWYMCVCKRLFQFTFHQLVVSVASMLTYIFFNSKSYFQRMNNFSLISFTFFIVFDEQPANLKR